MDYIGKKFETFRNKTETKFGKGENTRPHFTFQVSPFPELVSISKHFETTEMFGLSQFSIFFMFQSVSSFSLYNALFQCFETPEMGPDIFTFSRACFNFVSKQLKRFVSILFETFRNN